MHGELDVELRHQTPVAVGDGEVPKRHRLGGPPPTVDYVSGVQVLHHVVLQDGGPVGPVRHRHADGAGRPVGVEVVVPEGECPAGGAVAHGQALPAVDEVASIDHGVPLARGVDVEAPVAVTKDCVGDRQVHPTPRRVGVEQDTSP